MKTQLTLISLIVAIAVGALAPGLVTRAANSSARQQMEEQILSSTVRFLVQTWVVRDDETGYDLDNTVGHATVMDGRYLVTHNHFNVPLSIRPQEGDPDAYGQVFLYNAAGQLVFEGPLADFQLVREDKETLVFAYKDDKLFQELGFTSAEFKDGTSISLQPGMEVAQVDWDGATTRVDWVMIQEANLEDDVPRLVLADGAIPGASGGGIFWEGSHVANNWRLEEQVGTMGEVVGSLTTAALNSALITGI